MIQGIGKSSVVVILYCVGFLEWGIGVIGNTVKQYVLCGILGIGKSLLSCTMWDSSILCSVLNWQSPLHYIFIRQQNNLFDRAHLLLRVDQFQPHIFREFSTEQSIDCCYLVLCGITLIGISLLSCTMWDSRSREILCCVGFP